MGLWQQMRWWFGRPSADDVADRFVKDIPKKSRVVDLAYIIIKNKRMHLWAACDNGDTFHVLCPRLLEFQELNHIRRRIDKFLGSHTGLLVPFKSATSSKWTDRIPRFRDAEPLEETQAMRDVAARCIDPQ